ncbi:MAG: DUF1257 domain-containing protein [Proteobacteria bacterium]|nr:DUF1257 domain-containing protein [Pseudomonadota bacterium]
MSHFTKVKTKIVDLLFLKRALEDMDMVYEEGRTKIRGYLGRKMTVDFKVRTSEGYDIGFLKTGDTYEVVADWEMVRSFSQESFVRDITRRYAYHVVTDQLQSQDYQVVEERRQGEAVSLTLRRS